MIRWIVGSSLKYRFLVIAAAAVLMLFGITRMKNIPVDVFHEYDPT